MSATIKLDAPFSHSLVDDAADLAAPSDVRRDAQLAAGAAAAGTAAASAGSR